MYIMSRPQYRVKVNRVVKNDIVGYGLVIRSRTSGIYETIRILKLELPSHGSDLHVELEA